MTIVIICSLPNPINKIKRMGTNYTTINIPFDTKEVLKELSDKHKISMQGLITELALNLKTKRIEWTKAQWKELKKEYPKDGHRLKKSWATITGKVQKALQEGAGTVEELRERTGSLSFKQVEKVLLGDLSEDVRLTPKNQYILKKKRVKRKG